MKKALPFLLVLCTVASALGLQQKGARLSDLEAIVATERAFSRKAAEVGTRDAFLAFMADDSIVFAPGPVNGRKSWEPRPKRPGLLSWEPSYADISEAGDMGYDMGPWEFRPDGAGGKPAAFGHFMTIWKKQPDGSFKFALDLGISNPQPTSAATLSYSSVKSKAAGNATAADMEAGRTSILNIERELSKASAERGAHQAYPSYMADEVRLLHEGKFPFIGRQAAQQALQARSGKMSWRPEGSDISRSLDVAYSYGAYDLRTPDGKQDESGYYVHVWKRHTDGRWKLVIEVLNPLPKKS